MSARGSFVDSDPDRGISDAGNKLVPHF